MIKRTTVFLFFVLVILASITEVWAQNASAKWPNSPGASTAPTISGNVTAPIMTFTSNLTANTSYSSAGTNTKTAASFCGIMMTAGPFATDYETSKYEEYKISPASGYNLNLTGVELYLGCSNSAGKLKAQIAYSTDGTNFTTIAQNGTSVGLLLGNATAVMQTTATSWASTLGFWSSSLNSAVISVANGGTFFLRVYPYATAAISTYGFAVANVKISGNATPTGVAPEVTTGTITNIQQTTATGSGTIVNIGDPAITVSGICWSTSANPTTANSKTTDGPLTATSFTSSMTGLVLGTTYHVRAYATYTYGTVYGADSSFTTLSGPPVVSTAQTIDIGVSDATSGGTVSADGGSAVTARGVCWSTSANPTTAGSHTSDGTGTGTFVSAITGLSNGVTYHVRAYATNGNGTSYGGDSTFTTLASLSLPTVTTSAISSITGNSASSGGNVTADGGATITARGVCWSTSASPTTADGHTTDGTGLGTYTSAITGLNAATVYHLRAYATNSVGTAYGADSTFTTLAIYFNKASSDVSVLSNWGSATDGTGGAPANFTNAGVTFNLFNASPTLGANWSIAGTSSKLVVGGSTALNFTIPAGDTLTMGAATNLTVASACSLIVSGAIDDQTVNAYTLTGTLSVASGGSFIINAVVPNTILGEVFQTGSNLVINQGSPRIPASVGGNVFWNSIGANSFLNTASNTIGGNLTITAGRINNGSGGTGRTLTVNGNLTVAGGEYNVQGQPGGSAGAQITTINGNVSVSGGRLFASETASTSGSGTLNIKGNLSITGGRVDKVTSTGNIILNGTSQQQLTVSAAYDSLGSLTVNNSAGLALASDVKFKGALTLTSGVVSLGSYNLTLDTNATIGGSPSASNFIDASGTGQLRKVIASVPTSFTFPVGTGSTYSPASLTLSSGTLSSAYIGVHVAASKSSHNTSATNYINRTWTLTANGITSPVYSDTLTYAAGDVVGTEASLVGGLYNGSAWTSLGAVDATNHYVMGSGLTSFGELTAGEASAFVSGGHVTVTIIPQGLYNSGDYLNSVDTISVYLADASTPYNIVDSAFVLLDSLTFSATATFSNAATGSYYVVVKQRTCVETWSATTIAFAQGSTVAYDFSDAQNKAYGDNQIQVNTSPSRWAIYGGDSNQDGYVDPLDLSLIDQDSFNYLSGRSLATDINGDGFVDPLDMSVADQNSFNYVGIKRPVAVKSLNTHVRPQLTPLHYKGVLKTQK